MNGPAKFLQVLVRWPWSGGSKPPRCLAWLCVFQGSLGHQTPTTRATGLDTVGEIAAAYGGEIRHVEAFFVYEHMEHVKYVVCSKWMCFLNVDNKLFFSKQ